LLFYPGSGGFSRSIDCRVLIAENPLLVPPRLRAAADIIVPRQPNQAAKILMQRLYVEPRLNQVAMAAA
jgi:hypothetical protein